MGVIYKLSFTEKIVNSAGYERFSKFCIKVFFAVTLVALLLKYVLHQPGGTILLIVGMGSLAAFAFLSSFREPKISYQTSPHMTGAQRLVTSIGFTNFMNKLKGWGLSIGLIGLLYKLNHWPGGTVMFNIALPIVAIVVVMLLVRHLLTRDLRS